MIYFPFYGPLFVGFCFFLFWRYNFAFLYKYTVDIYLWDDIYIISLRFAFIGF